MTNIYLFIHIYFRGFYLSNWCTNRLL